METDLRARAAGVRAAQRGLGAASSETRTLALEKLAELLVTREEEILAANRRDLDRAAAEDLAAPLLGRLALSPEKLRTLVEGVRQLIALPDPIGRPLRRTKLDDGLVLTQVQSPLGVLLIIFESRPDAVIQIGSLALRAGDGVLLKGGREARDSNRVLVGCLRDALAEAGLPSDAVVGVESRDQVAELLALDEHIDLVIPRGSGELVRSIQSRTRIPVMGHAEGVCHLYLHADADPAMAAKLAVDGKVSYPSACNATEALLVHRDFLPHLAGVGRALTEAGVTLRADEACRTHLEDAVPAGPDDLGHEYGDLVLAVYAVDDLEQAIAHIHSHGSAHTEAVVTEDKEVGRRFLTEVDAASVFVNASTRFADGYRYGLGAEVGVSTGRLHARGPVGVDGLLTTRWLLRGAGQATTDYGPGGRAFAHEPLPLEEN